MSVSFYNRPHTHTHTHTECARTATDAQKVEAVQRKAARWMYRVYKGYKYTAMLKDLNCCPLNERRIDSRLVMLYKL